MEITDRDRREIRSVIERQLEAFQRDDAVGAFAFASAEIQAKFGTPEQYSNENWRIDGCYLVSVESKLI